MPLSENEQRLLDQIERALVEDDPKFASTVRSTNPRTYLMRRVRRSFLLFVVGLVVLLVGVVLNRTPLIVIFGVLGFATMLFAASRGAADLRRISGRGGETSSRRPTASRRRTRPPFTERIEERWRRRWDDH
ncbi:DUF3040 domain-containing protein [Protofrankia coriariae]|uniref:SNF family Na+-dependent transporter n=1 Tax=Protofrankia coriariae TaxID=1562887 RepID=A0ABR5F1I4_9ACTN|nr:DUF3040 domain-containing protein [Protofrankia coriariae]KLL10564.1 SNF family Na+-dependent transporter [Protofrankia coriariae]